MSSYEHFFRYTSNRWLRDEKRQQAFRYQRFNVDALKSAVVTSAVADGVSDIRKLAEGNFNKVFKVQLTDGRDVIARIPTPLTGTPHLVTACEVATMQFLRNRLGLTQVPRILLWSSRASDTPVGAEYIIMDVVDGVQLSDVWHELTMDQKILLVNKWIEFESVVIKALSGGGYGSLYYRKDLPAHLARDLFIGGQKDDEFVLGPSTAQTLWKDHYGHPTDLDLDCGPWPDVQSFLQSHTNCERAWIRKYAKRPAREFVAPWELPPDLQVPEEHIRLLDMYDRVAKYFISTDERLHRPTFTLRDSHQGNIFLSREALARDGTIEISAVIDWQHTAVIPLYLVAMTPQFIENAEPAPGQEEKAFLKEINYLRKAYHALYQDTGNDVVWAAALPSNGSYKMSQQLPYLAQFCWFGGYITLKLQLIKVVRDWEAIAGPGVPCPLGPEPFSKEEILQAEEHADAFMKAKSVRDEMCKNIGIDSDGMVTPEDYDRALQANNEARQLWIETCRTVGVKEVDPASVWPYNVSAPEVDN